MASSTLQSVELQEKLDGSWQATHVPSGRVAHGLTQEEATESMRELLGMEDDGTFAEPLTSDRFEGVGKEIALFLEGPISDMLASHSGFARLEGYDYGVAHIRLGGGCQGCPASTMTLLHGVKAQLQEEFGEEVVEEVIPAL